MLYKWAISIHLQTKLWLVELRTGTLEGAQHIYTEIKSLKGFRAARYIFCIRCSKKTNVLGVFLKHPSSKISLCLHLCRKESILLLTGALPLAAWPDSKDGNRRYHIK